MAAQLLGTTGNWGIPQDQAGILITDQSFDFSNQEKPVLSDFGFRISDSGVLDCGNTRNFPGLGMDSTQFKARTKAYGLRVICLV